MWEKIKSFLFKNTSTKQTVAKNTFWLSVSNFGGRLIKAIVIIYAARVLGTAGYGVFSYALTLAGTFSLFMDPGINSVLMRDVAKSSEKERHELLATSFIIKLALIAIGVAIVIFIGPYFSTLPGAVMLLPVVAFVMMFDTLREFLFSLFRSLEKMEWEAGVFLFTNLAIVIFGFAFMISNPTAESLGWGYAIGTMLGGIAALIAARDYVKGLFQKFSSRLLVPILQSAWPFAVAGAMGLLLTNTDILIISWMKTASDVGIYSAAIRIIQVLYLVPGIIQLSTLPIFSRLAKRDDKKFRSAMEQTIRLIFVASIPMAIGGILLGTQIMSFIFGSAFAPGGLAFKLLAATLIVDYPGSIVVNAIFAYGHQKSLIITSAIAGISNVVFDVLLIPRFGIVGSAVATLIAQTISNIYLWYVMKKINYFTVIPQLKKIIASGIIMGIVTAALLVINANVVVNVAISTVVYFGALKLMREPLLEETAKIFSGASAAAE